METENPYAYVYGYLTKGKIISRKKSNDGISPPNFGCPNLPQIASFALRIGEGGAGVFYFVLSGIRKS